MESSDINIKGKLFHRIKYRNVVASAEVLSKEVRLAIFKRSLKNRKDITNKIVETVSREKNFAKTGLLTKEIKCDCAKNNSSGLDIKKCCETYPTAPTISRHQRKEIVKKINARELEDNHPLILKKIFAEIEDEYIRITKKCGIEWKLKSSEKKITIEPYRYLGRTPNYSNFLQRRKTLQLKFILYHPLIKRIQYECITNLRSELFNLKFKNQLRFDEFANDVYDYANEAVQYLHEFHKKIINIVEQTHLNDRRNYLGACSGLLSVNISKTIAHTLLHIVHFTDFPEVFPYLKLNLTFNGSAHLHPTANEIISIYHKLVEKIIKGSQQITMLEKNKRKQSFATNKIQSLCLTDEYIDSILSKITNNILRKYKPILACIKKFDDQFIEIYNDLCSKGADIVTSDLVFDLSCNKVLFYKKFLPIILSVPDNEYFSIGQLTLTEYRETIKEILLIIINIFFTNLCAQNEWENSDICENFNIIKVRATEKVITTEQIIETSKYMTWVKNDFLNELSDRVINNLEKLAVIIQLGKLDDDHLKINAKAINWLHEIQPILDENTLNYEQLKFEAEEKLQRVIEDINADIKNVTPLLDILNAVDDIRNVKSYLNSIILHMVKIKEIATQIDWINGEEVSLSFPKSTYPEFEDLKNFVYPFYHLLKLCLDVQRHLSVWLDGQLYLIVYEDVKETVDRFYKELLHTQKQYRAKLRQAQDENFPLRFKGTVDDPDMLNWPAPLKLCTKAINLMQDFQPSLSVIKIMCNEALMKRHWIKMSNVAGFNITPNAGTTLRKITQIDLKANLEKYEQISISATKEEELLRELNEMQTEWTGVNFTFGNYENIQIIVQIEEIEVVVEDHIIKVIKMLGSIFVKPYKKQVQSFYDNLLKISETIAEFKKTQSDWLYLLPIFSCTEILQNLEEEFQLFQEITDIYKTYLTLLKTSTNVKKIVNTSNVLNDFIECNRKFDLVANGVNNYIEIVREYFPRMYFLSENEMYRVLSLNKKPKRIENLIENIFTGISCLQFDEKFEILSIKSKHDEVLLLRNSVATKINEGHVEKWLKQLEIEIKKTISLMIKEAHTTYTEGDKMIEWIVKFPNQILQTVFQIIYTSYGNDALNKGKLCNFRTNIETMIETLTDCLISSNLLSCFRRKLNYLLMLIINKAHRINDLIDARVESANDFKWISVISYYLIDNECYVYFLRTSIKYDCEYVDDSDQMVITQTTEKFYHSLMLAYSHHLHGICQGRSGSGKTETVKSLARSLAVNCVFFYIPILLNLKIIFDFLKGIAASGCWLCLEQFENFNPEMISVFTQEVYKISSGLKSNLDKIVLNKSELKLNKCFICLNAKTATPLPTNMKSMFRSVILTQPDILIIAQTVLASRGFKTFKKLANQIFTMRKLFADLLPQSVDFGLRTIKEILNKCTISASKNEEKIVYEAIQSINKTRLSTAIENLFDNVLNEIFHDHDPKMSISGHENIIETCQKFGFHNVTEEFIIKVIQLNELIKYKRGIILIGETFSGKTTLIDVLQATFVNITVQRQFINPKAMTFTQLYGGIDTETHKWCDGVITKYLRQQSVGLNWIILDGPIDSGWIDGLNTTLDETQRLFLASGEVLTINDNKSVIFEVDNLHRASPAIISRCGMVFLEPETIGWKSLLIMWIKSNNFEWKKDYNHIVIILFEWLIPACLGFIKNCVGLCKMNEINLVRTMIQLFEMFLNDAHNGMTKKEEDIKNLSTWIQAGLVQAAIWGLASNLNHESRIKFDEFFKQLWKGQNKLFPYPTSLEKIEVSLPIDGAIFDHCYVYKAKGNWKFWPDVLKNEKIEESYYFNDLLIPTIESVKYLFLINMHIKHRFPILLVGPSSTGKTYLINHALANKIDKNVFETSTMTFSPKINASQIQEIVLSKLYKKKNGHYGPTNGKRAILFIDDVNVPQKDSFNTRPPLELIRKFFDHQHWYDRKTCNTIYLENLYVIAAMDASINNRTLCKRFLRHFNVFSINELSEESITRIFTNSLFTKWKKCGFPSDILSTVNQIVNATYHFYKTKLKPTPQWNLNFFNFKNFAKVIQVCAMIRKEPADSNKKFFFKQWVYEILRVLGDKLMEHDHSWLFDNIKFCVETYFKENFEQLFEYLLNDENEQITFNSFSKLIFLTCPEKNSEKFDEIELDQLHEIATNCLKAHNKSNLNEFNIILFEHALIHLSKICRILAVPCSNLLQIGLCHSGRQTLVRLACLIHNQEKFFLEINNNYTKEHWRKSFKMFLKKSGGHGKPCTFFIREEQIVSDKMFEDIDYLLKVCDIPGLFSLEEKQELLDLVRESMQEKCLNIDDNIESIFHYYQTQCRRNLHIILSFNLCSNRLRKLMKTFSSLREHCEVDYCQSWPNVAYERIAENYIKDVNISDEIKTKIISSISFFHGNAMKRSKIMITNGNFFEFMDLFVDLITRKQTHIVKINEEYLSALEKLSFAAFQIAEMQRSLAEYRPQLEAMTVQAIEMAKQIETETIEVEKASNLVKKDEAIANEQAAAAQILKLDCEADLAQAIPILEDAISALNTLKPTDITLVKSMKNPPDAIKLVMAAVCVIKDVKPDRIPDPSTGRKTLDYWGPSKRILGDMIFLQTLKDFDKDNIKPEIMVKIRKDYLPHKDFKPHIVAKASSAAEGLCKWIIAMDMYDKVAKEVAPKKEKLEKAEREYAVTMAILNEKKGEVTRIEQKLADLHTLLNNATKKQQKLQRNVDACKKKLNRAQKLIGGLSEDKTRWTNALDILKKQYDYLPGDVLLSSATIAYLGSMLKEERLSTLTDWFDFIQNESIPCDPCYDFIMFFQQDFKMDKWLWIGLPSDVLFGQNGLIGKQAKRWPLFVDPQNKAASWLKLIEKENGLVYVKYTYPEYLEVLKKSIKQGIPILIENVDVIQPFLTNLITKSIYFENDLKYINLAGTPVQYNENFRLFLTTNRKDFHCDPELSNRVNVINFQMNKSALNEYFLTLIVEVEEPQLKKVKKDLNSLNKNYKNNLRNIEDKIIQTILKSKRDILEDEHALQILNESKKILIEIKDKQKATISMQKRIDVTRQNYEAVATRLSIIFFSLNELSKINHMYQFSLKWFTDTCNESLPKAHKFKQLNQRCSSLIDTLTYELYCRVSRSIFEKDKLLFSFLISFNLLLDDGKANKDQLHFITKLNENMVPESSSDTASWLSDKSWKRIEELKRLDNYENFKDFFAANINQFKDIFESKLLENANFPSPFNSNVDKLIITSLIKPEMLHVAIANFITSVLGKKFVNPPAFNISLSFMESHVLSPLIFILTPETNPISTLVQFAKEKHFENKLVLFSPGQSNKHEIESLLRHGRQEGLWICLQNCHVITSWLHYLDLKLEEMDYNNTHENFRLWLTTNESHHFSISLLERSVKIIKEPPKGLKNKLLNLYTSDPINSKQFYSNCPGKYEIFSRLLFSLSFFYSVIQERRNFGRYGWNISYEFHECDFITSIHVLQSAINNNVHPFDELYYLIGHCIFSGRSNDEFDARVFAALLMDYLNPVVGNDSSHILNGFESYGISIKTDHQVCVNHIIGLPNTEFPQLFGLNNNYEQIKQTSETISILKSILIIYETSHEQEKSTDLLAQIETMAADLPQMFDLSKEIKVDDVILKAVLMDELQKYNALLKIIKVTLNDLEEMINGHLRMTDYLDELYDSILSNKLPQPWLKICYNTDYNLPTFLADLKQRFNFFYNFCENSKQNVWLDAFYSARSFLVAKKLHYSKMNSVSFEDVCFRFCPKQELDQYSKSEMFIDGLSIVGACWNKTKKCLDELMPKHIYNSLSTIAFVYCKHSDNEKFYECPLYKGLNYFNNEARRTNQENLITSILIRSEKSSKFWIQRRVAIVCHI